MDIKAKLIKYIAVLAAVLAIYGCETEDRTYQGPELVQFTDTMQVIAVMNSEELHDVRVAVSKTVNYDRNYAVRVVTDKTNAIEGYHFQVENYTAIIKAGEYTGSVKIKCYHERIEEQDSLGITLTLVNQEDPLNVKGLNAHVIFKRVCEFQYENHLGYCIVSSQFLDQYTREKMRLCAVVEDTTVENGIIIKDYLQDGYNIKVRFDSKDPLKPYVAMEDNQVIAKASGFFSYIYQDDKLRVSQPDNYPSVFNSCGEYMIQYNTFYIEKEGVVGTFRSVVLWISDAEAEYLMTQGY